MFDRLRVFVLWRVMVCFGVAGRDVFGHSGMIAITIVMRHDSESSDRFCDERKA